MTSFIFAGLKHSGKTTHGRLFAESRRCSFFDLDQLIEDAYAAEHDDRLNCREIYKKHGGIYFRDLENSTFSRFIKSSSGKPFVLSLGGGIVESPAEMLDCCSGNAVLVYLRLPVDVLIKRIFVKEVPPFLAGDDPVAAFRKRFAEKSGLLEKYADCIIDISDLEKDETQKLIAGRLEEYR